MEQTLPSLKYTGYAIALQEVPDEISLVISISGCPFSCKGCHSPYLQKDTGKLLKGDLPEILNNPYYVHGITCICFMGGDQNPYELEELLAYVKAATPYKTCVYSGVNDLHRFGTERMFQDHLIDYLKIGEYDPSRGGLDKPTTNQRMFKIEYSDKQNPRLHDITDKFRTNVCLGRGDVI